MLSKSKIKQGLQCSLALYNSVYHKFLAQYSDQAKKNFSMGHDVGDFARELFPDGVLVSGVRKEDKLQRTKKALLQNKPVFEASFDYRDILVQVDVLVPDQNQWKVKEVKAGTSIKEDYLLDLAIQYYVMSNQKDISFSSYSFWLVNKDAKSKDENFFKEEEVTEQVAALSFQITPILDSLISMISSKTKPEVSPGAHCFYPYECPFVGSCWKNLKEEETVLVLPEDMKQKYLREKKTKLEETDLNPEIIKTLKSKQIYFKPESIKEKLIHENPLFLKVFTRSNIYPEGDFGPYSRIPWGFALKQGDVEEQVILTSASMDKFWEVLSPLLGDSPIVVFDKFYEIYKILEKDPDQSRGQRSRDQLVNLSSVLKYNLLFPTEQSYDLNTYSRFIINQGVPEVVTADDLLEVTQESDFLKKIEATKSLRNRMKEEVDLLSMLYFKLSHKD